MSKRLLLIFLFLGNSAYSATLTGIAKSYPNENIKLLYYTDLFSRNPIHVAEQTISENGQFEFEIDVKETRLVALKIKGYRSNFYIAPKSNYRVQLGAFDPKSAPPLSKDKYLPARLIEEDKDQINKAVGVLNVQLDSFEQKHYLAFLQKKAKPYTEDYSAELKRHELYGKNLFFTKYIDAVIGSLYYKAQFPSKQVFEQSLTVTVDYHNVAYVNLVNDFYNKWLNRYKLSNEIVSAYRHIGNRNLDSLKHFLRQNDFLKNDTLLEIIATKELFRLAVNDKKVKATDIDKILSELAENGVNRENRQIAKYYLYRLRKLGIGGEAPNFMLENTNGSFTQLKDFRGKYVYLDFWATWCKPCLKSLAVMRQLYPKYREHVEFISINIDERKRRFEKHMSTQSYPWTVLYAGGNEQIKEDYEIVLIPLYYLIDPNGKIIQSPAFSPGGGIERTFEQLFREDAREEIKIWDWKFDPKNKGE